MGTRLVALTALAALLAACGEGAPKTGTPTTTPPTTSTPTASAPPATATPTTATPTTTPATTPTDAPEPLRGIDASHHQGDIDWPRVADAGISFAYLKATEGTGFTDPRFAEHRRAATRAGIDVAGYHYFQLCSDGTAQAEHFLDVLRAGVPGRQRSRLPPALDLELVGSCDDPPPAATLLAEVREFLAAVDRGSGRRTLVYLYPDFEQRYGLADDLDDHQQWVRRLGERQPRRPWAVWQYDDAGSVPGVAGGVDLNLAKESLTTKGR